MRCRAASAMGLSSTSPGIPEIPRESSRLGSASHSVSGLTRSGTWNRLSRDHQRHSVGLMSTGESSPTSTRRTVAAVFLAGVSVFLVLYETQGLLPAIRDAYGIDGPTASLTVSATNVAMACFLIPFSMLAPRIGHARQIGAGVIVAAILALVLPFTPTPELLIVVQIGRAHV